MITVVGLVGVGQVGRQVAALFALAGIPVIAIDRDRGALKMLGPAVEAVRAERRQAGYRANQNLSFDLRASTKIDDLNVATVVFEAVPERLELKRTLYRTLERCLPTSALIVGMSAGFLPTDLACELASPERFVAAYFANPPHAVDVVEVAAGDRTSEATVERVVDVLRSVGCRPIVRGREVAGSIGDRLELALLREAFSLVRDKVATPAEIDTVVRSVLGPRLCQTGSFESADVTGLPTLASLARSIFTRDIDTEFAANLDELIARGRGGARSGAGFYDWAPGQLERVIKSRDRAMLRLMLGAGSQS